MTKKQIWYLGLEIPQHMVDVVHYPLIEIVPRPKNEIQHALNLLPNFTHIIFTSKSAAEILKDYNLSDKIIYAVGKSTAKKIESLGWGKARIAEVETAEGVIALLEKEDLTHSYIFWPHSALSRENITKWLEQKKIKHTSTVVYDTKAIIPKEIRPLGECEEIIFTSPSTIDAFIGIYKRIPKNIHLTTIGPITNNHLENFLKR